MEVHAEDPNELPPGLRKSAIVSLVISSILFLPTAAAVLSSCAVMIILFWVWFSDGGVLEFFFDSVYDPIDGRAANPLWAMVVGGVIAAGTIILIITYVLAIVISLKGLSKQRSPVENEVLPPLSSCSNCRYTDRRSRPLYPTPIALFVICSSCSTYPSGERARHKKAS
jgi:hypothetical protein